MATKDKRLNTVFQADLLTRDQLEAMWRGDDMAARIVETLPDEMTREGFELKIQEEQAPEPGEELPPGEEEPKLGPDGEPLPIEEEKSPEEEKDPNAPPPEEGEQKLGPDGKPLPPEEEPAKTGPDGKPLPPEDDEEKRKRGDGFPPGKGGPPGAGFGAPPPPPKPPGVINKPNEEPKQQAEEVMAQVEDLDVLGKFHEAACYERAYGGAAILVGADDGAFDLKQPLNLEAIKSVKWLTVLTPRELVPVAWYADPAAPKYGEPEIWRIQREADASSGTMVGGKRKVSNLDRGAEIHESRLIIFPGIKVSRLQVRSNMAPGFGDSVLVRCNRVLTDFNLSWSSASILLQDFAPSVFKMKDLADLIASDENQIVINRALAIEMSRSTARAVMIDSEEEYERQTTPITGLDAMLEKFCTRLAAAADMPVTLLMGQAPAGLNATGASDIRFFYDRVKSRQKTKMLPRLKRLLKLIMLAKEGPLKGKEPKNWSITFNPLWQLTELEKADLRVKQAAVDKIEIDAAVTTPEEVAASRHGGDEWSSKTVIDFEGRKTLAVEHETAMAEHAKQAAKAPKMGPDGKPLPPGKEKSLPTPGKNPFAKGPPAPKADALLWPFEDDREDSFDPDQPRDENGKWGEGGGGGSSGGNGGGGSASIHPTAVKGSSTKALANRLHEIVTSAGHNAMNPGKEYAAVAKELKARKVTTFAKLAAAREGK